MVDVVLLQSASYVAAAIGVCVAAVYYVMNLRVQQENLKETAKNRRITLTATIMEPFATKELVGDFYDLNVMEWSDLDDYMKKYDSRVNRENFIKRMAMWNLCEKVGGLYREGLLDLDTIELGSSQMIEITWTKFKPIIEMYRRTDFSPHSYGDFENLAENLIEYGKNKFETRKDQFTKTILEHLRTQAQ